MLIFKQFMQWLEALFDERRHKAVVLEVSASAQYVKRVNAKTGLDISEGDVKYELLRRHCNANYNQRRSKISLAGAIGLEGHIDEAKRLLRESIINKPKPLITNTKKQLQFLKMNSTKAAAGQCNSYQKWQTYAYNQDMPSYALFLLDAVNRGAITTTKFGSVFYWQTSEKLLLEPYTNPTQFGPDDLPRGKLGNVELSRKTHTKAQMIAAFKKSPATRALVRMITPSGGHTFSILKLDDGRIVMGDSFHNWATGMDIRDRKGLTIKYLYWFFGK